MSERLPTPFDVALFVTLAVLCAAVVEVSPSRDSALFFASVPLFLICAIMGYLRSVRKARAIAQAKLESDAPGLAEMTDLIS